MKTIYHNAQVITPNHILANGSVVVENDIIIGIERNLPYVQDAIMIDVEGKYLSPGFIDIHVHGGGGFDFMDATIEAFEKIAQSHKAHGTIALMPTTLTSTPELLESVLQTYQEIKAQKSSIIRWLGMHIEGPYFALAHKGAQDARFIRNPNEEEYTRLFQQYPVIARWSVAPELPGALAMGKYLCQQGVIASIAHTDAVFDDVILAVENGYSLLTHLYSAMNGVVRRNTYRMAGAVESAFLLPYIDAEIIADGIHIPPALLQLIVKNVDTSRIALITDAMRAAGTNHTTSILGDTLNGQPVLIEDGVAKLPDRSAFAGSIATMNRLVYTMWKLAGIPLADCIRMASTTPARIANVQHAIGSIAIGKQAKMIAFDENVHVHQVFA
ncbi:N-acetylglucosamine-6-phosphate deacetylase [Phnomibacter ginsenosidimutans]|uniref:N-acetylglucosamine-6-phosphate deacetylase n=1 Tax=Phnomibacter ginsenosidimutans TaxID=2676868 RepID=A0A6I6G494_9BACT|nr:N-acetylglucosamine-6-phosphate deacetylase [Phnomibacter ginsenosidimutans]QGW27416.1 N-acetylglucosamine-6-phosphate deacetylase [Phnomibacter ginsenosidimutans]